MRSLWWKRIRGTTFNGGHGIPSKVEGSGIIATQTAQTFQSEKHINEIFHVLVSKYLRSLFYFDKVHA